MRIIITLLVALLPGAFSLQAEAQPITAQASTAATGNIYAQQQIDLLPGFSATTDGFEARIKPLETQAGRWSAPQKWTPYQRYLEPIQIGNSSTSDGQRKNATWPGNSRAFWPSG